MDKIDFNEAEVSTPEDFTAIGTLARLGVDRIVGGAIAYPAHWAGFTVQETSAVVLTVTPGELFKDEIVYSSKAAIQINIQLRLPVSPNDQKWLAVLVRGSENTTNSERLIETDADTEQTVLIAVPKIQSRDVSFVIQEGNADPTPLRPAIPADECALCYVRVSTSGIEEIVPGEDFRVKSLYETFGRVRNLELVTAAMLQRISTIETDLANLAGKIKSIPRPELVRQLQRDQAMVRRLLSLPEDTRSYWYDPGLVEDAWGTDHGSWLARVDEGARFGWENQRDAELEILDPDAPTIRTVQNLVMPLWEEVARISVEGRDSFINISQLEHTVTTAIERKVSRSRTKYGPTINVCENQAEWAGIADRRPGSRFTVNGETFVTRGLSQETNVYNDEDGRMVNAAAWNADPASAGHKGYSVQQVSVERWTETYWDYVTEEFGVNGSLYAQTFLVSQPMIATSIDLDFTRIGAVTGDVHLILCETNMIGAPDLNRVITRTTVTQGDLATGWKKFSFRPSFLEAGRRYAWCTVTTGNHALATVTGNKFAQGTQFACTDGAFFAGDLTTDFAFRLNAARFASPRTIVQFDAVTLDGGMTEIDLLYAGWEPDGTSLTWEIRPSGGVWRPFIPSTENPLYGLPPLVELRGTFIGTTDLQPCIIMDNKARVRSNRPRATMTALSDLITFGFDSDNISIETVVDHYDPAHHTCANKLVKADNTVINPTSTTVTIDFTKPSRRHVVSLFSLGAPIPSARVRIDMTSDTKTNIPFIQNEALYAL